VRIASPFRSAASLARLTSCVVLVVLSLGWTSSTARASTTYPVGVRDSSEPSAMAPPGAQALPGYRLAYINDFNNPRLPPGWSLFTGDPGGISSPNFSAKHVIVTQGLLRLQTYRDPADHGLWTTGGLCQCQHPVKYGAFFVRSRLTAGGSNSAELLWPENNTWPPEIDFNENSGHIDLTTATTHWGTVDHIANAVLHINMTQWHTWGVIWTPTKILYVVDGHTWREFAVPSKVPHLPMTLDFEQRAVCPSVNQCPTQPSAMQIDWVAEYQPDGRA
jgi:hypothetical protein